MSSRWISGRVIQYNGVTVRPRLVPFRSVRRAWREHKNTRKKKLWVKAFFSGGFISHHAYDAD